MAVTVVRKRSPRAPVISLREAVDRVAKVYEKEGRHAATADIVAQHLGYKSADNGAAKQLIATLGYYGLLERPSEGMLAVSKSFEEYTFAPSNHLRANIIQNWLTTPGVFAELREKFPDRLPSEASLKYELIQRGFKPAAADECLAAFLESVQYVEHTKGTASELNATTAADRQAVTATTEASSEAIDDQSAINALPQAHDLGKPATHTSTPMDSSEEQGSDRIPVRLAGGRRAWLVIPSPFYTADKRRLVSQIELLLTDDDDE